MFERLNTGSKITNPAEVRRGALGGPFMELVIELAKLPTLVRLAAGSKKRIDEREHEELVLRFFAYRDGLDDYNDRPAEFLFNYAKSMNEKITADPALGDHYRQRFLDMINFVEVAFPYGFRRTADGKATPRARFESISIGSSLALEENPHLARQPPNVGQWLHDAEFKKIVSAGGSNAKSRILTRTQFVRDRLLGR